MTELWTWLGVWTVVSSIMVDGTWLDGPPTTAEFSREVGGQMLIERGTYSAAGRTFEPVNVYSWDRFRSLYRVASLDDTAGLMDVYEGEWSDGCLLLSNVRSGTWYRRENGDERMFRLRICPGDGRIAMEIEEAEPSSSDWVPFMRILYARS